MPLVSQFVLAATLCLHRSYRLKGKAYTENIFDCQDRCYIKWDNDFELERILCYTNDTTLGFLDECQNNESLYLYYNLTSQHIFTNQGDKCVHVDDDFGTKVDCLHLKLFSSTVARQPLKFIVDQYVDGKEPSFDLARQANVIRVQYDNTRWHMNCYNGEPHVRMCSAWDGRNTKVQQFKLRNGTRKNIRSLMQDNRYLCYKEDATEIGFWDDCKDNESLRLTYYGHTLYIENSNRDRRVAYHDVHNAPSYDLFDYDHAQLKLVKIAGGSNWVQFRPDSSRFDASIEANQHKSYVLNRWDGRSTVRICDSGVSDERDRREEFVLE